MENKSIILSLLIFSVIVGFILYNESEQKKRRASYINSVLEKHHLKYEDLNLTYPVLNTGSGDEADVYNDEFYAIIDSIDNLPIAPKP